MKCVLLLLLIAQCTALVLPLGASSRPAALRRSQPRMAEPAALRRSQPRMAEDPSEMPEEAVEEPKKPLKQDLFGPTTTIGTKTINASPAVLTVGVSVGYCVLVVSSQYSNCCTCRLL